jgi:cysteine desulfurase
MSRVSKIRSIYPHTKRASATKSQYLSNARYGVRVYLDNAAATPVDSMVKKEMVNAMELYGNPSSLNNAGRLARNKIYEARNSIGRFIGAKTGEIIFTSSGTEANNLAILGLANIDTIPREIITTPIEHPSVLEPLKIIAKRGWKVTFLEVDRYGFVDLKDLEKKLNPRVAMVSIIYANNEIGTVQPITKISKILKNFRNSLQAGKLTSWKANEKVFPLFHIDACQAVGYLNSNVNSLGVDLMTFNGTKIYGPRGIGVLYVRSGTALKSLIFGGNQEVGLRAGTENLPSIVGMAKAVSLINLKDGEEFSRLRDYFIDSLKKALPGIKINGPEGKNRLANNINISIPNMSSENLLLELDNFGVYVSAGSACTAHSVEPSHVLKAIGVDKKYLAGALRLSLGRQTTKRDIDYVVRTLVKVVGELTERYRK